MDKHNSKSAVVDASSQETDSLLPIDYEFYQHPEGSLKYRKGYGHFDGACLPAYYQQLLERCNGRFIKPFNQQSPQSFLGVNGYYPHALAVMWVSEHLTGKSLWSSKFCQEKNYSGSFLKECISLSQKIQQRMKVRHLSDFDHVYAAEFGTVGIVSSSRLDRSSVFSLGRIKTGHSDVDGPVFNWAQAINRVSSDPGCYIFNIYNLENKTHKLMVVSVDYECLLYRSRVRPAYIFDPICGEMFFENYHEMLKCLQSILPGFLAEQKTNIYLSKWSGRAPHRYGPPPKPAPWFTPRRKTWARSTRYCNDYLHMPPKWMKESMAPDKIPDEMKVAETHGGICMRVFSQKLALKFASAQSGGACYAIALYWLSCHMHDDDFWCGIEQVNFPKQFFYNHKFRIFDSVTKWTNSFPFTAPESGQPRESAYFAVESSIGLRALRGSESYSIAKCQRVINDLNGVSYRLIIMEGPVGTQDAHAVAIAACGGDICFFDPNFGEVWFPKVEGFIDWFIEYIHLAYAKQKFQEFALWARTYERISGADYSLLTKKLFECDSWNVIDYVKGYGK